MPEDNRFPTAPLAKASPVPKEALHSRRFALTRKAEERYPGAGWTIYQCWREWNEALFGRQMETCEIRFGTVSNGCRFGRWKSQDASTIIDRSLLHKHGKVWRLYHEDLGRKFVRDVLLHQMVHQYITQVVSLWVLGCAFTLVSAGTVRNPVMIAIFRRVGLPKRVITQPSTRTTHNPQHGLHRHGTERP
jgi:hypothetical protein